ncbi:MAG: DnaJ domain-containing protein [Acidobacteriota bacterium]|nr:DnaJ domain-containing protein [Acidobacteriota bacterium]
MSSNSNLETNGKLSEFPLAELLTEAAHFQLSGSFRLSHEAHKIAVYLEKGAAVYAASNLRQHRLSEIAVGSGILSADELSEFRPASNDFEFGEKLIAAERLMPAGLRELQERQTVEILRFALSWFTGEWVFTPLVRVRESLRCQPNLAPLLTEAARLAPNDLVFRKFRFNTESFGLQSVFPASVDLYPQEAFLLSRFDRILNYEELQTVSGLPDTFLPRSIYVLWLGGFLHRYNWAGAFSEEKLALIQAAKIERVAPVIPESAPPANEEKEAARTVVEMKKTEPVQTPPENTEEKEKRELEEYLRRTAKAQNHYQVLGVDQKVAESEIKKVYFSLAKRFHPDKFHNAENALRERLQESFTCVSQAYETLKDKKSRELYDFKIRKSAQADAAKAATPEGCFEAGKKAFEDGNYVEAIRQLARAIQLDSKVAAYHAAYGRSLTAVPKYRYQAESEFLTALKIEPNNTEYRLYLAEFYLEQRLPKRAEGEVRRVLALEPNNQKAKRILDNLTTQQSKV